MLKWALIFAVIAGVLGFGGIAGAAAGVAKLLFLIAVIGFALCVALGVFAGKKLSGGEFTSTPHFAAGGPPPAASRGR